MNLKNYVNKKVLNQVGKKADLIKYLLNPFRI